MKMVVPPILPFTKRWTRYSCSPKPVISTRSSASLPTIRTPDPAMLRARFNTTGYPKRRAESAT